MKLNFGPLQHTSCNSIILKGTVLGNGCVVGAGAVVAGKFEDKGNALYA